MHTSDLLWDGIPPPQDAHSLLVRQLWQSEVLRPSTSRCPFAACTQMVATLLIAKSSAFLVHPISFQHKDAGSLRLYHPMLLPDYIQAQQNQYYTQPHISYYQYLLKVALSESPSMVATMLDLLDEKSTALHYHDGNNLDNTCQQHVL